MSERRKRLHELLLALISKEANFELIEDDSSELVSNYSEKDKVDFSRIIDRNRKILKKYQSLVKSAITLDAIMDSENDENIKIQK